MVNDTEKVNSQKISKIDFTRVNIKAEVQGEEDSQTEKKLFKGSTSANSKTEKQQKKQSKS